MAPGCIDGRSTAVDPRRPVWWFRRAFGRGDRSRRRRVDGPGCIDGRSTALDGTVRAVVRPGSPVLQGVARCAAHNAGYVNQLHATSDFLWTSSRLLSGPLPGIQRISPSRRRFTAAAAAAQTGRCSFCPCWRRKPQSWTVRNDHSFTPPRVRCRSARSGAVAVTDRGAVELRRAAQAPAVAVTGLARGDRGDSVKSVQQALVSPGHRRRRRGRRVFGPGHRGGRQGVPGLSTGSPSRARSTTRRRSRSGSCPARSSGSRRALAATR
jgi:hypothetical protein